MNTAIDQMADATLLVSKYKQLSSYDTSLRLRQLLRSLLGVIRLGGVEPADLAKAKALVPRIMGEGLPTAQSRLMRAAVTRSIPKLADLANHLNNQNLTTPSPTKGSMLALAVETQRYSVLTNALAHRVAGLEATSHGRTSRSASNASTLEVDDKAHTKQGLGPSGSALAGTTTSPETKEAIRVTAREWLQFDQSDALWRAQLIIYVIAAIDGALCKGFTTLSGDKICTNVCGKAAKDGFDLSTVLVKSLKDVLSMIHEQGLVTIEACTATLANRGRGDSRDASPGRQGSRSFGSNANGGREGRQGRGGGRGGQRDGRGHYGGRDRK